MTTPVRRAALFGTLLAVALAVLSARSDARVAPVDTEKTRCQMNVNTEFVQQTPTDRNVLELLSLAPGVSFAPQQATVTVQRDSKERVRDFFVDGVRVDGQTTMRMDFDSINFNAAGCWFKGLTPRTDFGDGYSGKIQMEVRYRPNLRMFWNVKDLRGPGGPIKKDKLFFFLPASTTAEQPPPEAIPVVPVPPVAPVPPVDPAPGTGFPIYLNGPNLLNGAKASGKVWAIPHTNCDLHTVIQAGVTYRMCLAGEGDTSLTAFNVTPKKFDFKKDPIPQGWEWSPFACEPGSDGTVGCTAKGKYRGYDILSTITNLQVTPGTLNFGANINVRLLSTGGDVGFRAAGQIESLGF